MNFQIDTSNIELGDVIPQHVCEAVIGITEQSDFKAWSLAMLQLLGIVQKQVRERFRREITVRIVGSEIHVLSDQESAAYNPKRFETGLRIARRSHRRLMAVNVARLTADQKDAHMKIVSNQAHKLSMLRKREEVALTPTERKTPAMVFAERKKT